MIKPWKVKAYAVLVKAEKWELENYEGNILPVIPEEYVIVVAEFLATGELAI
ncbi:CD1375 family protein [Tissierella sp. MB52-C2]|uniref:CD1375 family protein n=1 Tax=Tissierella sp. MB52-C2 TaxID=3070999 RepID=UPI00280BE8A3|nr:CD1375 family protein [Tissierella sp. MB52-C2]WMM26646.1 CD1375 family protein [Tissierella sp. MB52-C2]